MRQMQNQSSRELFGTRVGTGNAPWARDGPIGPFRALRRSDAARLCQGGRPMSPLSASARSERSCQLVRGLVAGGYATEEDLVPLLGEATQTGAQVGPIIIRRSVVPAPVVVSMLAQLSRLPKVDFDTVEPTPSLADLIPASQARDYQALPVQLVGQQAVVAFAEPPEPADVRSLSELWASRSCRCWATRSTSSAS